MFKQQHYIRQQWSKEPARERPPHVQTTAPPESFLDGSSQDVTEAQGFNIVNITDGSGNQQQQQRGHSIVDHSRPSPIPQQASNPILIDQKDNLESNSPQFRLGQSAMMDFTPTSSQMYSLHLQIYYKTKMGESIAVIGSTEELGRWREIKVHLHWTEGHIWVLNRPIMTNKPYFQYKYVLLDEGKLVKWESGVDRIADLRILPESFSAGPRFKSYPSSYSPLMNDPKSGHLGSVSPIYHTPSSPQASFAGVKHVELYDEWETFTISFSVFSPMDEGFQDELLLDFHRLGVSEQVLMKRVPRKEGWLMHKYGQEVIPWECRVKVDNLDGNNCGQWKNDGYKINYCFKKISSNIYNNAHREREPARILEIQNPCNYRGQLGTQGTTQQRNTDRVFAVNGMIDKCDGNILSDFYFEKIPGTNIYIGSYPLYEFDVQRLSEAGISAVLNLQTNLDQMQRGVILDRMIAYYRQHGINSVIHFPLNDNHEEGYSEQLFEGAKHLDDMLNKRGNKVFVHCSSGLSRSPAVVISYLCLFLRHEDWEQPREVEKFLRGNYRSSLPNMKAIEAMLLNHKDFQMEEAERQKRQREEDERAKQLRKAQEEAERLRLKRLAEQEAERLRLQRLEFEEAERLRKQRLAEQEAERLRLEKEAEMERLRLERLAEEERLRIERLREEERKRKEAEERERRRREAEAEAQRLMKMLKQLDDEELERKRRLAMMKEQDESQFEHCAFGDPDLIGLSEQELDTQCDELFGEVPIKFVPTHDSDVDLAIAALIEELNIRIPILHIKDKLYLIGSNRISCEIKRDIVMLRIGGGYEKFVEYVPRNQRFFERCLVVHMIKSGESLEWVIDALYNNKKIKNIVKETNDAATASRRSRSKSPVSSPNRTSEIQRKVALNLSSVNADLSGISTSPGRQRQMISFRETSPYSKTKTANSLNIQKIQRDNSPAYVWDDKTGSGGPRKSAKAKKSSKNLEAIEIENVQQEIDYQQRKEVILKDLNVANLTVQQNQPVYYEEVTVVNPSKKLEVVKTIQQSKEVRTLRERNRELSEPLE